MKPVVGQFCYPLPRRICACLPCFSSPLMDRRPITDLTPFETAATVTANLPVRFYVRRAAGVNQMRRAARVPSLTA
jgi:hypothetical protein